MDIIRAAFTAFKRRRDIERAVRMYDDIQPEASKLIDDGQGLARKAVETWPKIEELIALVRELGAESGLLSPVAERRPIDSAVVLPEALKTYSTKWIQESLNIVLGTKLEVDGKLYRESGKESETEKAVKRFQREHMPTNVKADDWVDGIPGVQTCAILEEVRNRVEATNA